MKLSRVFLDLTRRDTLRALTSPQLLHGAIESCFPGERQRHLWRLDWLGDRCCLLLTSDQTPNLASLSAQFGCPDMPPETKDYQPFLDALTNGAQWRFRLCGNPVHAVCAEKGARGKVMAHVTAEQQRKWLLERAEKHGFSLREGAFDVVQSRWMDFSKHGSHRVAIRQVTFEGVLTVTDADALREALTLGIGRGKAYGCGLLTLVSMGR